MPGRWYIRLLGPVAVIRDGEPLALGGPTARAVLAVLALRGEAGAGVDELIGTVWRGPRDVSRDSVYHYIKKLRAVLDDPSGPQIPTLPHGRYRLDFNADMLDWGRCQRFVDAARVARNRSSPHDAAELLTQALALWQGVPLDATGDRLDQERRRLTEFRLAATEELATLELARGQPQRVYDLLNVDVNRYPYREVGAALVIQALAALGRREEAGAVFHHTRQHLVDELGLDPSLSLQAAYRACLVGSAPSSTVESEVAAPPRVSPGRIASGLPRPDRHFTGRARQLDQILAAMSPSESFESTCVISGMAGVGKTALATFAAASLVTEYPDACLFVDLAGFTPGREPIRADEALDRLLRRLDVPGSRIPTDLDERSALYRSRLIGQRILVVLDNARNMAQVQPLLSGAAGCGTIVTGRHRMAALDDAVCVELEPFTGPEAVALFRSVIGSTQIGDEPAIERIVRRCGALPLAVRIAAARYHARPLRTLVDLEVELAAAASPLPALSDGDRSVTASLMVSIVALPDHLRRLFTIMAVHPGTEFDTYAIAALADTSEANAAEELDALASRSLIVEQPHGRYRFHDLVAAFAREQLQLTVPREHQAAALRRLVDFHLRAADAADSVITPHRFRVELDVVDGSAKLPPLQRYEDAFAWLTAEQPNLTQLCLVAGAVGLDGPCWQLAFLLRGYYFLTRLWQPWHDTHSAALAAARRCGDQRAAAITLNNAGLANVEQGKLEAASEAYDQSLRLFRAAGDARGEQSARANQAWILFARGRYQEFIDELHEVRRFYREIGSDRNLAITLRGIGLAETRLGRYPDAVARLMEALDIVTALDMRLDVAMTLNALGEAHASDTPEIARALHERALTAAQRCGSEYEQARADQRLGDLASFGGDQSRASND